jgi:DNA-binding transcriptional MerR regulator
MSIASVYPYLLLRATFNIVGHNGHMTLYTPRQASISSGIAESTVRLYCREYADFLSPSATPPRGEARRFTPEDVAVFKTVKTLRDQGLTSADILIALQKGERYEPDPDDLPSGKPQPEAPEQVTAAATMALDLVRGQIRSLENERDYLRRQLDAERAARIDAEKAAAHLAGLLEARSAPVAPAASEPPAAAPFDTLLVDSTPTIEEDPAFIRLRQENALLQTWIDIYKENRNRSWWQRLTRHLRP